jgi:hypothetical protein
MERIEVMITFTVCIALSACTLHQAPDDQVQQPKSPPTAFSDHGVSAQKRLGAYVNDSVISSNSRACWARLQGEGAIATDLTYRKSGADWTFERAVVTKSTLAKPQGETALGCLQAALRGTSFPVATDQELEKASDQFIARLGWPVPWPPEGGDVPSDVTARMISTGGGGLGDIAGCSECVSDGTRAICEARASGGHLDCREYPEQRYLCSTASTTCLRGFFGGSRGVVMF